jgi:serine/threonine protein kinase
VAALGQYTLLAEIGRSVLGVVYRALDGISGQTIALKVLDLDMLDDVGRSEMNARLQRDLSALSGTCIKITDFGMAELAARNRTQTGLLVGGIACAKRAVVRQVDRTGWTGACTVRRSNSDRVE